MPEGRKINSEIGRTAIEEKVKMHLWAAAGGRCELCNKPLFVDDSFGVEANYGQLAHIHAVSKGGPRHKVGLSQEEKNSFDNLMLLCPEHHHMIDTMPDSFVEGYLLLKKKQHEERIRRLTEISDTQTCRIVTYFSNIDNWELFSDSKLLKEAAVGSNMLPGSEPVIALHRDSKLTYQSKRESFERKAEDLQEQCQKWFDAIIREKEAVAVFALAPQPLLFVLGTLLNDQFNVKVFQCHRTGHKWRWPDDNTTVAFEFFKSRSSNSGAVALVVDLSASVIDDRVTNVLGNDINIYHLTISSPNRIFVTNENIQDDFVASFRSALEHIKNENSSATEIHLFQVMPNSLAVRAGMDYMPKAVLPLVLYEQASAAEGFFEVLKVGGTCV